ncbi:hypothetical protein L348_09278 [Enterobacter sp. MGH 2]|uniref:hypothetical protein n=1 Tax=Enterobacter cloacae complex TaxID=354276 RepID=UPI00044C9B0F|nr:MULTISPECIES: hypothetical protein [Enterobacter cloacae complex]EHF5047970.1 hypothetical protein [Enterobacter hormaechei]EHF5057538.1 hypothetical protein [Enterobacter hormaechei]EHF8239718.1 hypothetical protein [Enterobacter hormaechei]EUM99823.1 hypothetical protein L348_09278 [Enterobacter sp. MGH 2]EZR12825.1 hypothetical protein L398_04962 [Enterobacter sp. BWH 27]
MIYRRGWVPVLWRHELEKRLKEQGFDNWKEICNFLCGEGGYYAESSKVPEQYDYVVVDNTKWMGRRDATFWQRLNRLWFVPLYLLTIPFQWLIRGRMGFESTSKVGAFISRITGLK